MHTISDKYSYRECFGRVAAMKEFNVCARGAGKSERAGPGAASRSARGRPSSRDRSAPLPAAARTSWCGGWWWRRTGAASCAPRATATRRSSSTRTARRTSAASRCSADGRSEDGRCVDATTRRRRTAAARRAARPRHFACRFSVRSRPRAVRGSCARAQARLRPERPDEP